MRADDAVCMECGEPFAFGELVVPVGRIIHRGNVSVEVGFNDRYAHVNCAHTKKLEGER